MCKTKRNLASHKALHKAKAQNPERMFECSTCKKTFDRMNLFKAHKIRAHKSRKTQIERKCEFCDYKTTRMKMFAKHVEWRHTRENARKKERYRGWDWGVMRKKWKHGKERKMGRLLKQ